MTAKWTRTSFIFVACSLSACDVLLDGDEPLWQLEGALVTDDPGLDEGTTPAIYWSNVERHLDVLEPIEGSFRAGFTLRVDEPPPSTAQMSLFESGIAPLSIAFGQVVAADDRGAPFYPAVVSNDPPGTGAQLAHGETLIEGDDRAWLRGGAPGHLVAYSSEDPPDDAVCLAGLSKGFNLMRLTPKTSAEVASNEACEQQARDGALEIYNALSGTSLTPDDLWNDEAAQALVNRTAARLECQNGCDLFRLNASIIPPDSQVTLEILSSSELVDWF
jgi:hypothetical protein